MQIIAWIVTILFGVTYWPQLWHSYRTKSVGDISPYAWFIQSLAYALAISYGVSLMQWPMIIGYVHGLLCSVVFLLMYWKYTKTRKKRGKRGKHV